MGRAKSILSEARYNLRVQKEQPLPISLDCTKTICESMHVSLLGVDMGNAGPTRSDVEFLPVVAIA